uniref:Uncharacterized protein n=1 Tax=Cacopsylla melanoneura TaxID=428564 RepID=A0A8D8ZRH7_9HEMI
MTGNHQNLVASTILNNHPNRVDSTILSSNQNSLTQEGFAPQSQNQKDLADLTVVATLEETIQTLELTKDSIEEMIIREAMMPAAAGSRIEITDSIRKKPVVGVYSRRSLTRIKPVSKALQYTRRETKIIRKRS